METVNLEKIKARQQQIIDRMYADLENTATDDRYFTTHNVERCAADLDAYVAQLAQQPDSKAIANSIRWIFQALSTFEQEEESPEFLWGFIYNGYTKELTDFILNAAFAAGLKKGKPKTIPSNVIYLKHNPHAADRLRVYIGSSPKSGVVLGYNQHTSLFEYLENPHGESYALPVFDLVLNEDRTALSFDVLAAGAYKTILLKAAHPADRALLNAIYHLHQGEQLKNDPAPDHCSLELELTNGVLTRLTTMNYDANNRIINMFTPGTGMKVFVQELDANGCFQNSDNMVGHPEIVDEQFVVVDAVPDWKYYVIDGLEMEQDVISVHTQPGQFEYENGERKKVVARETPRRTIRYPIRSYEWIKTLLREVLAARKPFVSRF